MHYQVEKDGYQISTDVSLIDLTQLHATLSQLYWAENIPFATVKRSVENSLCFGLYQNKQLIGFARLVTDYATFGYLADVFILPDFRGLGLSKWLMTVIMAHPDVPHLRRIMLVTRDAQTLYQQFGFNGMSFPERVMEITRPNIYKQQAAL